MDKPARPAVFLSSAFKDTFNDESQYVPLRRHILENKPTLPVWLWAYEHYWSENSEKIDPAADTIIDRCFAGIQEADLFVFLPTSHRSADMSLRSTATVFISAWPSMEITTGGKGCVGFVNDAALRFTTF
jgi:hypothetical protein